MQGVLSAGVGATVLDSFVTSTRTIIMACVDPRRLDRKHFTCWAGRVLLCDGIDVSKYGHSHHLRPTETYLIYVPPVCEERREDVTRARSASYSCIYSS